jgi:hypothetical protein
LLFLIPISFRDVFASFRLKGESFCAKEASSPRRRTLAVVSIIHAMLNMHINTHTQALDDEKNPQFSYFKRKQQKKKEYHKTLALTPLLSRFSLPFPERISFTVEMC